MAQAARLAHYELLERDVDASILQLGAEDAQGAGAALAVVGGVPTAVARRVQQSLSLAAKCTELQRKLEAAVAERAQAKTATERLTRELERANQKMAYAQQPYNYLVEVLQNTERKLEVRSQWPVRAPFPQGRCRCPGAGCYHLLWRLAQRRDWTHDPRRPNRLQRARRASARSLALRGADGERAGSGGDAQESRTHASTLQMEVEAARAAKRQLRDVTMDREALRDDMRTLLEERTMLQDMRKTLSSALARPINPPAGTGTTTSSAATPATRGAG